MTTSAELEDRWQRYAKAIEKANTLNRATVFAALSAEGISHILIGFDGEGDSGQIDGGAAFKDDEAIDFPQTKVTIFRAHSGTEELTTEEVILRDALEELCYGYLEQDHGGWENNDGAFGEFRFSVAERTINLEMHTRIADTILSDHSY
jgi:hypothetical protein